jgi:DNA alkylation damage repair protein AlkB
MDDESVDAFRATEKKFRSLAQQLPVINKKKRKLSAPERVRVARELFCDVIDFRSAELSNNTNIQNCKFANDTSSDTFREYPISKDAKLFTLSGCQMPSGFYVMTGALSTELQLDIAERAVEEYSQSAHTNLTNLHLQSKIESESKSKSSLDSSVEVKNEDEPLQANNGHQVQATSVESCEEALEQLRNLWRRSVRECNDFRSFKKLRWASLGYHYDWTCRMYKENAKSPFPENLSQICQSLASSVGLRIKPEAGIVNYYPTNAQMCGHLDDAEHCMDEPIISISLGRSAIFLLGGRTKGVSPIPILLRSGDVVIMSGESRYCYHGVPAIFPLEDDPFDPVRFLQKIADPQTVSIASSSSSSSSSMASKSHDDFHGPNDGEQTNRGPCADKLDIRRYLDKARINLNVRRVTAVDGVWRDKSGSGYKPV